MLRSLPAALAALVLLTGCADDADDADDAADSPEDAMTESTSEAPEEDDEGPLEDTYSTCSNLLEIDLEDQFADLAPPIGTVFALEDDGTRMIFYPPEDDRFKTYIFGGVNCVLDLLKAPKYVVDKITTTPASDGPQDDTWDDITVEWNTPGPDYSGFEATFTQTAG